MIHSVGVDIVEVARIREAVQRWGERFLKRVFTDEEVRYCLRRRNPYPCLAARFALKEAFIKALRPEVPVGFRQIEVKNDSRGAPYVELRGLCLDDRRVHLSISHENEFAVAVVVIEEVQR